MTPESWQRYMLEAERSWQSGSLGAAVCFYQQALGDVYEMSEVELAELASMRVATCHRLADFWRAMDEPAYELRYLKLASELGCCRGALLAFLKRHPNPEIAKLIQLQDKVQGCELIGRFRLN
ncbi:hypothetical protein C3737_18745 [Aeromonas jandaei]|uniref:DUF2753 family protein n=1 Tax=Aeromonas jandaei TaxID=650 RepID=UPI000CE1E5C0|nr:DUF2753 family protein [Aeromonas jandaei]PPA28671.1 hypothetical protein C3737_18745 [Aeromonas jandaei]